MIQPNRQYCLHRTRPSAKRNPSHREDEIHCADRSSFIVVVIVGSDIEDLCAPQEGKAAELSEWYGDAK